MGNRKVGTKSFVFAFAAFFAVLAIGAWWVARALAQGQPVGPDAVASINRLLTDNTAPAVWGCVDGTQAYSTQGGVCNIGDAPLPGTIYGNYNHPMWTQNLYRLKNNRFEQIGMSWVKHDGWNSDVNPCPACGVSVCNPITSGALDIGCRDVYNACQNGDQNPSAGLGRVRPRSEINAASGVWPVGGEGTETECDPASGGGAIACRLQVKQSDLAFVPAQYFLEQQVITPDETSETRNNNVSYKAASVGACNPSLCNLDPEHPNQCGSLQPCTVTGCSCPGVGAGLYPLTVSSTQFCQQPAIHAWKGIDSSVVESDPIQVPNDGLFILAAKATSIGCDWWRYEYALYNMNSDRSAREFRVPLPTDTQFEISTPSIGFHDVDYHSGDGVASVCSGGANHGVACAVPTDCPGGVCSHNFDGTNWTATVSSTEIRWTMVATTPPENANALRWGTLYNFRFEANRPPSCGFTITIVLFKPGTPTSVTGLNLAPTASPVGACCVGTTCTVGAQTCCTSQGGSFKGVGTTCEDCDENGVPDVCQQIQVLPGACCLSEEQCIEDVTPCACTCSGGWFLGLGSVCPESCGIIPFGPSQVPPEP